MKSIVSRLFSTFSASAFVMGLMTLFLFSLVFALNVRAAESVRAERKLIRRGNSLYNEKKYREASKMYEDALKANPESSVGLFNLGMSQIRQGLVKDTTKLTQQMLTQGKENLSKVAALGMKNPLVASLASYNLGNMAFNDQDYSSAISFYKQALRINPDDNNARRNLRIAQLKQQEQDKNNKDEKNQDQKQDQDKKDQQDQQNQQNQDQNQNKNDNRDSNKDQPKPQNEKDINPQTADQILRAVENKENQTRNRVMRGQGQGKGKEQAGSRGGRKNW